MSSIESKVRARSRVKLSEEVLAQAWHFGEAPPPLRPQGRPWFQSVYYLEKKSRQNEDWVVDTTT